MAAVQRGRFFVEPEAGRPRLLEDGKVVVVSSGDTAGARRPEKHGTDDSS